METASFKDRLEQLLRIKNMTKSDFAKATGLSKSSITRYMSGKFQAKQDTIFQIANALCIDPAWLLGYDVPIQKPIELNCIEKAILKDFRTLPEDGQRDLIRYMDYLKIVYK